MMISMIVIMRTMFVVKILKVESIIRLVNCAIKSNQRLFHKNINTWDWSHNSVLVHVLKIRMH